MENLITNKKFQLFLVFLISFGLFLFFQFSTQNLFCNDPFYHIKCADLIRDQGIIKNFPWLKFTILHDQQYVDHHFLFHLALVPFLYLGLIPGAKLATALFASLVFVFFFWFLERNKIKFAFCWTILLLFASKMFLLRLNLARAQSLSLVFLFLGLFALIQKNGWALIPISFFYVWLFDGFVLLPLMIFVFGLVDWIKQKKIKEPAKALFLSLGGTLAGIIINPYFPQNLRFLYIHIIKIGLVSPFKKLPIGAEWYSADFWSFFLGSLFAFLSFSYALALFILRPKTRKNSFFVAFLVISIIFFFRTIISQRFSEYWVPFSLIACAFAFNYQFQETSLSKFKQFWQKRRKFFLSFLLPLVCLILFSIVFNLREVIAMGQSELPYDRYKKASTWLAQNTPRDSIVFNINWDDFPQLFFWNDQNYYIAGLDPSFLYEYNKELWEKYESIRKNEIELSKIAQIIKEDFGSRYLFLSERNIKLAEKLDQEKNFKKVYEDEKVKIYYLD